MPDYFISIKSVCSCGASLELTSHNGNNTWLSSESDKWLAVHRDCPKPTPLPNVTIPSRPVSQTPNPKS